jgi:hypothetical protein
MEEQRKLDPFRLTIALLMIFALVATLSWLQGRYDQSDHRKAEELVKTYRPKSGGVSIPEVIVARHPYIQAHDISWSSEITSSCLGTVKVSGFVPKRGEHPAAEYKFDVLLTDPSIHPTDYHSIEILRVLDAKTSTRTSTATSS